MATSTDWKQVVPPNAPPYAVFGKTIEKSPQDDREYRIIKLENGLEAMVIHDSKADKAAASLDVAVGHLSDPDDMPGTAHFCEHLLFMGTEKFPKENEYSEYLAKHNGASNAYTSVSNTNYYFSVATSALPGALARFSAFFHCPLFAPSCTSRELNAVDSEHKKNHQNDMWRIFQTGKHLTKEGHPWSKFGSGNRESLSQAAKDLKAKGKLNHNAITNGNTLTVAPSPIPSRMASPAPSASSGASESEEDGGAIGRETRRRLLEWWSKEYCASRMHLCVLGKESLDELSEFASTYFSPIPNRGLDPLPQVNDHPFGPQEKGTFVSIQTIMSFYALEFSFPLEWQAPHWKIKAGQFIGHLVGHEGPGSLHSYLKKKGWITELSTGAQTLGRGFDMFRVSIYLTNEGWKNQRSVIMAVMKYFSLLRDSAFHDYHQEEICKLDSIFFRFKEKSRPEDYTSGIAARMTKPYPPELLISAPSLSWPWKQNEDPTAGESKVREYLDGLRIDHGRVLIMGKPESFEELSPSKPEDWEAEPWYGTKYRVQRVEQEFIDEANGPNNIPELYLPGPNEFIPENLDVDKKDVAEPAKRPRLIRETSLSTVWHKKDDHFYVPKAYVIMDLRSPFANESTRASVLNRLYADLVTDSLTEFSYDASLAGMQYQFTSHASGLFISVNGYNDKLARLAEHVLAHAKSLVVDPARLIVVKEELKRTYENFFMNQSYQLSDHYARYMMSKQAWTVDEKLAALDSITAEEVQQYIKKVLSEVNIRMLATGNLVEEEAIKIAEMAEADLGVTSLTAKELNDQSLLLPDGCNYAWSSKIRNPNQTNSSLTYYVNYGSIADQRLRVVAAVLTQILKEPAFNILRTQEQLGYVVFCSGWSSPGGAVHGLRVLVQSERSAQYLESRVEAFLDTMKNKLEEMTTDEFSDQKSGVEKKWREQYKNLQEETAAYNSFIDTGMLDFLRAQQDADLLKDITKDEVYSLFMANVHPSSKSRSKLSVHMIAPKAPPKKVSASAAKAFEASVRELEPSLEQSVYDGVPSEEGGTPMAQWGQYWAKILGQKPSAATLMKALPELLKRYPAEEEAETTPSPQVVFIQDAKAFRSSLPVAPDPGPLAQWDDQPLSKL